MTKQRQKGTSLQKFYSSWKELHSRQSAAVHVVGASKHHGEEQMDDGSSDEEAEVCFMLLDLHSVYVRGWVIVVVWLMYDFLTLCSVIY